MSKKLRNRRNKNRAKGGEGGESGGEGEINKEHDEKFNFPSIAKHLEEPLFAISLVTTFLTLAYLFSRDLTKRVSMQDLPFMIMALILLVGILSIYFVYLYFKAGKKNYYFLGTPIFIFLTTLFLWYGNSTSGLAARDYGLFSLILGISLFFYALFLHGILKLRVSAISTLFIAGLIIHLAPAYTYAIPGAQFSGRYLAALDPYYYYRHANFLFENGFLPEREVLNYPTDPPDQFRGAFMVSMLMGSLALLLNSLGITVHDIAMIYPGVFAALTILVLYLLLRDLFSEMRPYNYLAGLLAAFMLIFSPAFAAKAIASNSEDDALGMFLLVSSFLLAIVGFRRKSLLISIIAGFSFLLLKITWGGYSFAIVVFGIFAFLYPFMNFLHKKNCIEHIPYYLIPVFISQLYPLILHKQGFLPTFQIPPPIILLPVLATLFVSFLLEFTRVRLYGKIEIKEQKFENKLENYLERNISVLFTLMLLAGVFFLISPLIFPNLGFGMDPGSAVNYVTDMIKGAKVRSIIGKTTAEQHPLCGSINAKCIREFYNKFGLGALFGLGMVFVLLYFIYKKRSLGAIFVIAWSLPMVWGVINKAQYQFTASVPIIALGSTIGLILVLKRKDLEGLRVIPTLIFSALILLLPWFQGSMFLFGPFGGSTPMYMGAGSDRIFWDPTLQWLKKNTPENGTVVLTWWDYGHWIAAVSQRSSILDNVKARALMVQDIARFHVLIENESEALAIAKKYGATHVVIDWTMIGKSGAPHFIATSNVTASYDDPNREGEYMGYGQCGFSPKDSMLKSQLVPNSEGGFDSIKRIVFLCGIAGPPEEYIGTIIFEIKNDRVSDIKVNPIVRSDRGLALDAPISWNLWKKEHGGSILGVQSLKMILGNALNYGTNNYVNFAPYRTLIFVPKKFENYMMTRLYLGDHLEEYKQFGLTDIEKLKHFKLVDGFLGDRMDNSYLGYVRVYEIEYPEENKTTEITEIEGKEGEGLTPLISEEAQSFV
jgi:dolichyl-diphosphooligosaccharide--protein glycosyltransferase